MRRLCKRGNVVEVRKRIVVFSSHSVLLCCLVINVLTIDHVPGDISS